MIAQKADRLQHHVFVALLLQRGQAVFHAGPDPGAAADALRLKAEVPVRLVEYVAEFRSDAVRRLLALRVVRVRLRGKHHAVVLHRLDRSLHGAAGNRVRCEEHGCALPSGARGLQGWPHAFRKGPGQQRVLRPARKKVDGKLIARSRLHRALVQAHAGAAVLRRKAHDARTGDAVALHLRHHIGNEWMPVPHTHVDGNAKPLRQQATLQQRPARQVRTLRHGLFAQTNLGVAFLQFVNHVRRNTAATRHQLQVGIHLAQNIGRAVRQQQDGFRLCGGASDGAAFQIGGGVTRS